MNKALKKLVRQRANDCCEYCRAQLRYSPDSFSIEHILPKSKEGTDDPENLAYSCQGCNSHKFTATEARDPLSNALFPLYNPRKDTWDEHFLWSEDFTHIVGISPTGRATVERLKLNRSSLLNLRAVLVELKKHPV